jgi:integrase
MRQPGAKKLGVRVGKWLTAEQGKRLLGVFTGDALRDKRDYAMIAVLLGCGLRRVELGGLTIEHLQQREEHWGIADLVGKGGHVRTVPVPPWVKGGVDAWVAAAKVSAGAVFRAVNKAGRVAAHGLSAKVIWGVVKAACSKCGLSDIAPHDLRRTCARLCHEAGGSIQTTESYLGCKQRLLNAVNDHIGLEP